MTRSIRNQFQDVILFIYLFICMDDFQLLLQIHHITVRVQQLQTMNAPLYVKKVPREVYMTIKH